MLRRHRYKRKLFQVGSITIKNIQIQPAICAWDSCIIAILPYGIACPPGRQAWLLLLVSRYPKRVIAKLR